MAGPEKATRRPRSVIWQSVAIEYLLSAAGGDEPETEARADVRHPATAAPPVPGGDRYQPSATPAS